MYKYFPCLSDLYRMQDVFIALMNTGWIELRGSLSVWAGALADLHSRFRGFEGKEHHQTFPPLQSWSCWLLQLPQAKAGRARMVKNHSVHLPVPELCLHTWDERGLVWFRAQHTPEAGVQEQLGQPWGR